ncbi:MAG: hypothetical protein ABSG85_16665 [Spirochaetia bacterium]
MEKLTRVVVAESLKDDLRREADLARIDYRAGCQRFLQRASRTGSLHTLRSYRTAIERPGGRPAEPPERDEVHQAQGD